MTQASFHIDLTDASRDGVFFVGADDLAPLATSGRAANLFIARLSLHGCRDKQALLDRLATALQLSKDFGYNWDALADSLRDLDWLQARGYVLQFEHADYLQQASAENFTTLLDILHEAAMAWRDVGVPFFALVALPDEAFEPAEPGAMATEWARIPSGPRPAVDNRSAPLERHTFELDREFVELNQLLKLCGLCDSGGAGKAIVAGGGVLVDGQREARKTCKIRAGQRVRVGDIEITVQSAD